MIKSFVVITRRLRARWRFKHPKRVLTKAEEQAIRDILGPEAPIALRSIAQVTGYAVSVRRPRKGE